VFVPPLANTLVDLRAHITSTITEIGPNMLQRVWGELYYRLDVCRVTRGAILNICNVSEKKNLLSFIFIGTIVLTCVVSNFYKACYRTPKKTPRRQQ
jgi:hypothetical protein